MYPSRSTSSCEMSVSSSEFALGHPNANSIASNFYANPSLNLATRCSYPTVASRPSSSSSPHYMEFFRSWNYHRFLTSSSAPATAVAAAAYKTDSSSDTTISTQLGRSTNSSFHQYYPRLQEDKSSTQQTDEQYLLGKFHLETIVRLDTGESKNIQQITAKDFLDSAQLSQYYSSLLARIDYIGSVDKTTGKVELRFYLTEIEKTTSYYVLQEMPFFVYQYSCWSSVSPEQTHRQCGLKCRQLECGDLILAVTEQRKYSSTKSSDKPDYSQQSPTKCLAGRYINERRSSSPSPPPTNKRHKISNE